MSQLEIDMQKDIELGRTAIEKGELLKGLWILRSVVAEYAFMISIAILAVKTSVVLSGGLASIGIPFSTAAIASLLQQGLVQVGQQYEKLSREERSAVRMAIRFLRMGF